MGIRRHLQRKVALGSLGTRDVGDSFLISAEKARVLHGFQLYLRLEDVDRCGAVVCDTATHCSSKSGLRVVRRQVFGRIICVTHSVLRPLLSLKFSICFSRKRGTNKMNETEHKGRKGKRSKFIQFISDKSQHSEIAH